jgi:hypothetical protein
MECAAPKVDLACRIDRLVTEDGVVVMKISGRYRAGRAVDAPRAGSSAWQIRLITSPEDLDVTTSKENLSGHAMETS